MKKKLLIIELNEFNVELLKYSSKILDLKNIKILLNMCPIETICQQKIEHQGLDPWVQWVSVHTGKPKEIHKIKHLGEVRNLTNIQIWDKLSEMGISSGIWGAMNASRNNSKNCLFFFPDPWTFTEKCFPKSLNNFLALPRYYSKNYLSLSKLEILKKVFKLTNFLIFKLNPLKIIRELLFAIYSLTKIGLNNIFLFSIFDLISTKIFLIYKNKYNPDFSIIFLNSLAHTQHHSWSKNNLNKELKFNIKVIDKIIGMILKNINEKDGLIILNGLSQKNVEGEDYCIYRQKDPKLFLKFLNINFINLEQCMTNECHIFFNNSEELERAIKIISSIKINNEEIFIIDNSMKSNLKIFYQFNYFKPIDKNQTFTINNKQYPFYKYFELIANRTGSHVPICNIYSKNIELYKIKYNYDIFEKIINYFQIN